MKKGLVLMVVLLTLIPCALFAQKDKTITMVEETVTDSVKIITTTVIEQEAFFTNGFWYNWDLAIGLGPHIYLGDNDTKVKRYVELIAPAVDVQLTKWASPSIGISFGITAGQFKGLYQSTAVQGNFYGANYKTDDLYHNADPKWDYMKLAWQNSLFLDIYALAHLDISTLRRGYNPSRFYTADVYAGGGLMLGFDDNGLITSGGFNLGFINKFRITDYVKAMISLRGAFVADDFDGEMYINEGDMDHRNSNIQMDGNIGMTVGVTVHLGKLHSKWNPASRTTELVQINGPSGIVKEVDTLMVTKVEVPQLWFHIVFPIDKWEITEKEMVNLNAIADAIKSTPGVRYLVCGYADMQTATAEYNLKLSEKRANAVYYYLTSVCGVDPEMLVLDYKGGVDYMFYENEELSRCVMITTIVE